MLSIDLWFESGAALEARALRLRDPLGGLYDIDLTAVSEAHQLDFDAIIGAPASMGIQLDSGPRRTFRGVCSSIEHVKVEETGLSTYHLRLVPALWLATQNLDHRIFRHLSIPEIVCKVLADWGIDPTLLLADAHAQDDFRVQYGESDFAFISRLLEEAGITLILRDDGDATEIVLDDHPSLAAARPTPLRWVEHGLTATEVPFATRVVVRREVRPTRLTIRDFDFRDKPGYALVGKAESKGDARLVQHQYERGALLDDKPATKGRAGVPDAVATARLFAMRAGELVVEFGTNVVDLSPGAILSIHGHPRPELGDDARLLVIEVSLDYHVGQDWLLNARAVRADQPYRPPHRTAKPQVHGVQSAIVVGPPGQEIHTDTFGRVCVQLPWDHRGNSNEMSSCWMRVSQGSAGTGFGMVTIPRVGQEVLVGFINGDPDQPLVVGRVFNNLERPPYKLPDHATISTLRSHSSPNTDGYNELTFEDAAGRELLYLRAQRDLEQRVHANASVTIGGSEHRLIKGSLKERVDGNEMKTVGGNLDHVVKGEVHASAGSIDRHVTGAVVEKIEGAFALQVGGSHEEKVATNLSIEAGQEIHLKAGGTLILEAGSRLSLKGPGGFIDIGPSGVSIQGSMVLINSGGSAGSGSASSPADPVPATAVPDNDPVGFKG